MRLSPKSPRVTGAGLILMHARGRSRDMYREATTRRLRGEVRDELRASLERALAAGVARESVVLDPGLGFAKRPEHSYAALAALPGTRRARPSAARRAVAQVVSHARRSASAPRSERDMAPPPRSPPPCCSARISCACTRSPRWSMSSGSLTRSGSVNRHHVTC